MEGKVTADEIGAQAWAVYASSYWGGMELREHWGMPPAMKRHGHDAAHAALPRSAAGHRQLMAQRMAAIRDGGDACLRLLPSILREPRRRVPSTAWATTPGSRWSRPRIRPSASAGPTARPKPSVVRINGRDFLRVDYDRPIPQYLKVWRSAFERAVTAHPDAYENLLAGGDGEASLRDIWRNAVAFGNLTWGGDAQDNWTEAYWEETIRWSSILTFGMEAAGLAAFVALLNDTRRRRRPVLCNALYLGGPRRAGWSACSIPTPKLPTNHRSVGVAEPLQLQGSHPQSSPAAPRCWPPTRKRPRSGPPGASIEVDISVPGRPGSRRGAARSPALWQGPGRR